MDDVKLTSGVGIHMPLQLFLVRERRFGTLISLTVLPITEDAIGAEFSDMFLVYMSL
jgi:hypothetical protein